MSLYLFGAVQAATSPTRRAPVADPDIAAALARPDRVLRIQRPVSFGVYWPTTRLIDRLENEAQSCVCYADDRALISITGAAHDRESQLTAELHAGAYLLREFAQAAVPALRAALSQEAHTGQDAERLRALLDVLNLGEEALRLTPAVEVRRG